MSSRRSATYLLLWPMLTSEAVCTERIGTRRALRLSDSVDGGRSKQVLQEAAIRDFVGRLTSDGSDSLRRSRVSIPREFVGHVDGSRGPANRPSNLFGAGCWMPC